LLAPAGAERVYALDVNVETTRLELRQNPRLFQFERNARELRVETLPESVDIVVMMFLSSRSGGNRARNSRGKAPRRLSHPYQAAIRLRPQEIGPGRNREKTKVAR